MDGIVRYSQMFHLNTYFELNKSYSSAVLIFFNQIYEWSSYNCQIELDPNQIRIYFKQLWKEDLKLVLSWT